LLRPQSHALRNTVLKKQGYTTSRWLLASGARCSHTLPRAQLPAALHSGDQAQPQNIFDLLHRICFREHIIASLCWATAALLFYKKSEGWQCTKACVDSSPIRSEPPRRTPFRDAGQRSARTPILSVITRNPVRHARNTVRHQSGTLSGMARNAHKPRQVHRVVGHSFNFEADGRRFQSVRAHFKEWTSAARAKRAIEP